MQSKIGIHEGKTTPPKPYTEGQLIILMNTCGKFVEDNEETETSKEMVATRSGINEKIIKHGYIQVSKNIVSITHKGRILCEAISRSLLASPSMTAKWETYLRKIGNGEGAGDYFLGNIAKFIDALIESVPKQIETTSFQIQSIPSTKSKSTWQTVTVAPCPTYGKGSIVTRNSFYGCSNYKEGCKQTFPGIFLKKKITPKQVKQLCTKGQTTVIKGFTAKSRGQFDAALKLEDGKLALIFADQ